MLAACAQVRGANVCLCEPPLEAQHGLLEPALPGRWFRLVFSILNLGNPWLEYCFACSLSYIKSHLASKSGGVFRGVLANGGFKPS